MTSISSCRARQTTAIVGASGSGKSTLLSIIAGLDTPTAARCGWRRGLFALDEDARAGAARAQVGFVFQSFQLLGNLTALENVMLPLELLGRKDARPPPTCWQRVGLGAAPGHYPRTLSGGEQQRVALARAFVVRAGGAAGRRAHRQPGLRHRRDGDAADVRAQPRGGTTLVLVTHDRGIAAAATGNCTSRQAACPQAGWRGG
jgi:putative ABC transport system ATP-binding protein